MSAVVAALAMSGGLVLIVRGFLLTRHVDRKLKARGVLTMACGYGMQMAGFIIADYPVWASAEAAFMALCLHDWWNSGGGDGLKRKLRKLVPAGPAPRTT